MSNRVHEVRDAGWRRLAEAHLAKTKHTMAWLGDPDQPDKKEPTFAFCSTCNVEWSSGKVLHKRRVPVDGA